ncbi:MAG: cell division protein ZapA [Deltaproteobacteria bacterium]|nr:cell division protein ZapA [Deltaproteobacteria bacterium]
MVKKGVEVNILEQKLYVKSDEDEEYIRRVETYLNGKVEEIKNNTKAVSTLDVALLTVLNVAGDYLKTIEQFGEVEDRSTKLTELIERRLT